ncbi:unnamed protein product [Discosporangium mesarthrocarpum]
MEARLGNLEVARELYQKGIASRCTDMSSVWAGLGALEAKSGRVERAREVRFLSFFICASTCT